MNTVERAKNILMSPQTEWEQIKNEEMTVGDIITKYALILAAIPAICGFLSYFLFSRWISFGGALGSGILTYVLSLIGVYVLALVIDALAPSFGSKKDMVASIKVVAFSYTASWVAGILLLIPGVRWLSGLAGLYSLYLLWIGLKSVKEVPQEKMAGYFVVTIIVAIVVYAVIGAIAGGLTLGRSMMGF